MIYWELAIVVALIVLNGFLAMSELAVVSSRLSRLKQLVEQEASGSRRALALASDPSRFLSTVQIGITLVGVISGAFSGATLGFRLANWMVSLGMETDLAEGLGVGVVVVVITYASLIVGELVPKQIALRDPKVHRPESGARDDFLGEVREPARVAARCFGQDGASSAWPT